MPETDELFQGHVLSRVVLAWQNLRTPRVATPTGAEQNLLTPLSVVSHPTGIEDVLALGLVCEAVLVSQTCDVRDPDTSTVWVAPVFPLDHLPESRRQQCRRDMMMHYLPVDVPGAAYVDLRRLTVVAKDSLVDTEAIGRLTQDDLDRLNLKLSILLGRPALPDAVVAELRTIQDAVRRLKRDQRPGVVGIYVRHTDDGIDVLIVTRPGGSAEARLRKALDAWLGDPTGSHRRCGRVARSDQVTLDELAGRRRLALDYLSFPMFPQEA